MVEDIDIVAMED